MQEYTDAGVVKVYSPLLETKDVVESKKKTTKTQENEWMDSQKDNDIPTR